MSPPSPERTGTLRVLGIDPGFSKLGVAIVDALEGNYAGVIQRVLYADTCFLGKTESYRLFKKKLLPMLEDLWDEYGPFDLMCSEEPTEIKGNPVVSSYLWYVYGMIQSWAHMKGLTGDASRSLTPTQLKQRARHLMREVSGKRPEKTNPSKAEIHELLHQLGLTPSRSDHENDAVLAIIANVGKLQP